MLQPLPASARRQPGALATLGRGGAGAGARTRPADPAVDRLFGVPLVPCDGARELRRHATGGADERALRQRQGPSRGTPRSRPHTPTPQPVGTPTVVVPAL